MIKGNSNEINWLKLNAYIGQDSDRQINSVENYDVQHLPTFVTKF